MSSTPYMKFYIGDYLADTQHLSCMEHGAYMLLIMAYWQHGGPIEYDTDVLRRYTRTTLREFRNIERNVIKMFEVRDGLLVHSRIDRELEKRAQVSTMARHAINSRWAARHTDVLQKNNGRNTTPIVHIQNSEDHTAMSALESPDKSLQAQPSSREEAAAARKNSSEEIDPGLWAWAMARARANPRARNVVLLAKKIANEDAGEYARERAAANAGKVAIAPSPPACECGGTIAALTVDGGRCSACGMLWEYAAGDWRPTE